MKRYIALFLTALLIVGVLYGCGNSEDASALITEEKQEDALANAEIGDIVTFGTYKQDYDTYAAPEPIEWIVVDITEDSVLLVSKYVLDINSHGSAPYWLTGDFYETAFSEEERDRIVTKTIITETIYYDYGEIWLEPSRTESEESERAVFLLSESEVERYFGSDTRCGATDYVVANGLETDEQYAAGGKHTCEWIVRDVKAYQEAYYDAYGNRHTYGNNYWDYNRYAVCISSSGDAGTCGTNEDAGIRPAIWVRIA